MDACFYHNKRRILLFTVILIIYYSKSIVYALFPNIGGDECSLVSLPHSVNIMKIKDC